MDAVFVDSNVAMYLVGSPHPNRDLFEAYIRRHPNLHRYIGIDRRPAIADAFAILDALVQEVFPIARRDVGAAHRIDLRQRRLSGRDCLHLAVMEQWGIRDILTADRDFDSWPDVRRLP